MSTAHRPVGVEVKAAPAMLETRPGPGGAPRGPVPGSAHVDPDTGEVTALAAVTGCVDDVHDIIEVGAIEAALQRRTPRLVVGHDWARPAGRIVEARELRPGDPALPRTAPDGTPWPREAGALWIKATYLPTREGQEQRAIAQAFAGAMAYSIGYKVRPGGATHRGGIRHIRDLDIFEASPVLHGAHRLATQLDVKSAAGAPVLEHKATAGTGVVAMAGVRRTGPYRYPLSCDLCGLPAGAMDGPLGRNLAVICPTCVEAVDELVADRVELSVGDLAAAEAVDPEPGSEGAWETALDDEQEWDLLPDGELMQSGKDSDDTGKARRTGWRAP